MKTQHPMIQVDGIQRHRNNSNNQPIHPTDEGIRNFHRWFGDSKITDKHGRPLVHYHGTHSDVPEFSPNSSLGSASYFTDNPEHANVFTGSIGSNIVPVYLRVHKLYSKPILADQEHNKGMALRAKGYDGFLVRDSVRDNEPVNVAVFDPSNIKSVTGNVGDYSKSRKLTEMNLFERYTRLLKESFTPPPESITPNVKTLYDSNRYDISPVETKYGIDFNAIAKKPKGGVEFKPQVGRDTVGWHDPEISDLHTPYPDDPFPRTHAQLKPDSGYTDRLPDTHTDGVIYRGMSHEEFENVKKTGKIKSRGDYNMGTAQEGLTYYSRSPSQAGSYAHSFAPVGFKASGEHHAYVVAVKDPHTDVKVAGTGEDEVGIPHEVDAKDILHVYQGRAYSGTPGFESSAKTWSGFEPSSGSQPQTSVGWKKMPFTRTA